MLPSTCVVVPTYWTRAGGERRPGDAVYDHPTALDGHSTLPALLESLAKLDTSSFYVLVLAAVAAPDAAQAAERCVQSLVDNYPSLQSLVFGPSHLRRLHAWLDDAGMERSKEFLGLQHYPLVRNLQLAVPHVLHAEAIVALDDDEIVTDPAFLVKAVEPLGTDVDGRRVEGLSGHYLQENGSILLAVDPARANSRNIFDRKASVMNAATDMLEQKPGTIVPTPFCFGGNMEFSPRMAASVGFDPGITRGEDIDYLINARMEGLSFFLRKDLRILHCPPRGGSYKDVSLSKLEQDIIRFLYEREKLLASQRLDDLHPVTADELNPYPGEFLASDIGDDAVAALEAAGYPNDAHQFVNETIASSRQRVDRYLEFRRLWPETMGRLYDASEIAAWLRNAARTQ